METVQSSDGVAPASWSVAVDRVEFLSLSFLVGTMLRRTSTAKEQFQC